MIALCILFLVAGFVLLAKGADFFVDGAASFAGKRNVSGFMIGMMIVATGTSLPECAVSIAASLRGNNEMAISNVIGSNAFNLLVVCGACALFAPLIVRKGTLKRELPVSIAAEAVLLVLGTVRMRAGHIDGIILIAAVVLFLIWAIRSAKGSGTEEDYDNIKQLAPAACFFSIVGGAAAIVAGGWLTVGAAEDLALRFGMSETLVGLTVCAIGTSLPELFTSVSAARKGQTGMALGNVIGSNIFNVLLVAGISAAIRPIAFTSSNMIDLVFVMGVSALVMLMMRKHKELRRGGGIILLVIYVLYLIYICAREMCFLT